jgi:hypothetical protein
MMIAASGDKSHRAKSANQFKAHDFQIKREGTLKIGDFEMHMPQVHIRRNALFGHRLFFLLSHLECALLLLEHGASVLLA